MTLWERLLWALLWAATAPCVAKDCRNRTSIVGVEGEDTVLSPLGAGDGRLTNINWKKGENIVAGLKFPPAKEKQRLSLNSSSGNLILKNLSKEDTANYTAVIFINKKIKEVCFDLKILVRPDIICTINNDTIQLNCTSASQEYLLLRHSWDYIRNEEMTYVNDSVLLLPRNSNRFQKITCYVTAFSSSANNSINLSDCIPEEPDPPSSNQRSYIVLKVIGALVVLVVLALLALVIYCCTKKRCKKRQRNNESEPGARIARANCREESPELAEEERKPFNEIELENLGGKEKSGESPELTEEERKPFNEIELENLGGKERSGELPGLNPERSQV